MQCRLQPSHVQTATMHVMLQQCCINAAGMHAHSYVKILLWSPLNSYTLNFNLCKFEKVKSMSTIKNSHIILVYIPRTIRQQATRCIYRLNRSLRQLWNIVLY